MLSLPPRRPRNQRYTAAGASRVLAAGVAWYLPQRRPRQSPRSDVPYVAGHRSEPRPGAELFFRASLSFTGVLKLLRCLARCLLVRARTLRHKNSLSVQTGSTWRGQSRTTTTTTTLIRTATRRSVYSHAARSYAASKRKQQRRRNETKSRPASLVRSWHRICIELWMIRRAYQW